MLKFPVITILLVTLLLGCNKNNAKIEWEMLHDTNEEFDYRNIIQRGDSIILSGVGNNAGVITLLNEKSLSSTPVSYATNFRAYSIIHASNRFYLGSDSATFFYTTDFNQYNRVYIDSLNWVSYLNQQPILKLVKTKSSNHFFAVGGGNNEFGVTYNCNPTNNSWEAVEYNFNTRSAFYIEEKKIMWLAGNGILANNNVSELSNRFFRTENDNKYITDICFSTNSIGVATLHNGQLLVTKDGGRKWEKIKKIPSDRIGKSFLNRIKWLPELQKWVVIGNNGKLLWADKNAENWQVYGGFNKENLYDFIATQAGKLIIAASSGSIFFVSLP